MDSHLILWRHAEASIGIKDINRDLTEKGKLDGKKIADKPLSKISDPLNPILDAWDFISDFELCLPLLILEIAISNRPYISWFAWIDEDIINKNIKVEIKYL